MPCRRRAPARRCITGVAFLLLSAGLGCNRQQADPADNVVEQALPFHDGHNPETDSAHPVLPEDTKSAATPFQSSSGSRVLAAGTLLTVQLRGSLSAAKVHAGDSFTAVVADPLNVDGSLLVERGAFVTGRVESAGVKMNRNPPLGYIRLTLDGINLNGRTVALHTSSLFARATVETTASPKISSMRLPDGRRLTFRLIAPAALDDRTQTAHLQKLSATGK